MHDYVILYNSVCTSVATWFLCANQYRGVGAGGGGQGGRLPRPPPLTFLGGGGGA